jgi:hypothetical protein
MRKFAHAAELAVAISAPVLAGALMDHSVVSVLGAPGNGCSGTCSVGGAPNPATGGLPSNGNTRTQGGHTTEPNVLGTPQTASGTLALTSSGTGHLTQGGSRPPPGTPGNPGTLTGTLSGNLTAGPWAGKGHCTGRFLVQGFCG